LTHVGENIKRIRTAKNMTISDVANEHVSRGMISLIENGKTQPSIERLQHIARQLNVDITELVEEVPREDMRNVLNKVIELLNQQGTEFVIEAVELMKPILEKNPIGYEASRLYELYAKCLYHLYVLAIEEYNKISANDWGPYIAKAIELYGEMQMEWRVSKCYGFLAEIEFDRANYSGTIQIVEKALDQLTIMDSHDTQAMYITLISIKTHVYTALGQFKEAHAELDEIITFSREQLALQHYYTLLNAKAWLYYDEQKMELARQYVEECRLFIQLVKHKGLEFEHELTSIFLEEFFEKNYEKALFIAEKLQQKAIKSPNIPKEAKEGYISLVKNLHARVLMRLERYGEALLLFNENPIVLNERIQLSPMDVAIRILSNSYEALCHYQLGNQKKAEELARYTVDKLHNMPHSSFYHFAREVLSEVVSK
jgi:transcriptional regulator with XRE-family HTH domain